MNGFKGHMILSELALDINAGLAALGNNIDIGPLDKVMSALTPDPDNVRVASLLPSMRRQSVIKYIERTKNPVFIHLEDGTRLYMPVEAFRRIKGAEPAVGRTLVVVMQRRPEDYAQAPTQIDSCECH